MKTDLQGIKTSNDVYISTKCMITKPYKPKPHPFSLSVGKINQNRVRVGMEECY